MTRYTNHAGRLLTVAAAAGLAAVMAAVAPANAQNAQDEVVPEGWFKKCAKKQDVDICNVQNIIRAGNGQIITGVSLIDIKGKVNRKVFQVTVPTGRMIAAGLGVQIDGGKAQKLDYVICFPNSCVAEAQLNDALVASFKKGQKLTLTSINFQNQPNPIDMSLKGFTDAFDGPPLNDAEFEDRQKKLQEFVTKNNEDFAKKLKEEQDKAKKGD